MNVKRMPGLTPAALCVTVLLAGCQADSRKQVLATDRSQVQLRAVQTRSFATTDRPVVLRNVIATLQDLGFVIDKSDDVLGTVTGTKLAGYSMRMTVTIRPRGRSETAVRSSAQYDLDAVSDASPYQQFLPRWKSPCS